MSLLRISFEGLEELLEDYEDGYVLFTCTENEAAAEHYTYSICAPSQENAGFDLMSMEDYDGEVGTDTHLLNLGVRAMLVSIATRQPVSYWLCPRSSIYKTGFIMANSVGVIDHSYRGVLKAPVVRLPFVRGTGFKKGQRYFQIVAPDMGPIRLVRAVGSLPATARGEGGFGSTGLDSKNTDIPPTEPPAEPPASRTD